MIRWVIGIFIGLLVFSALIPELSRLGVGRVPGDVRFTLRGHVYCLPFGSAILWSAIAFLLAEIVSRL